MFGVGLRLWVPDAQGTREDVQVVRTKHALINNIEM